MKAVKTVYFIALLVGVFMTLQAGREWVTTSPFFQVARLEISGNSRLSPEEVKGLAGVGGEQNIFTLDAGGVRRRLMSHPWVKEATVKRKLPRTVKIDLLERKPLAVLAGEPEALLDEEGMVLEVWPNGAAKGLPRIRGNKKEVVRPGQYIRGEGTLRALGIVKDFVSLSFIPPEALLKVEAGERGHETIYLRGDEVPIVTGTDFIDRKLRLFRAVREHVYKKSKPIEYIDLTFRDKVVVKYQ